jgi:hypothetical protein
MGSGNGGGAIEASSRFATVACACVPGGAVEAPVAELESAFTTFGGVPEEVLMDDPRALVVRHDAMSRSVQFHDRLIAFAKH